MADFTIECHDTSWTGMTVFVGIFILVFSIGTPLGFVYMLYNRRDQLEDPETARLLGMLYKPYKPEFWYWESVVMSFKLVLLVGLVFTEPGTLSQHAAILAVCVIQLVAQARFQPFKTVTANALQYVGVSLTFATSFGGMLLQNMKVSQREAAQRLFGKDANDTRMAYKKNISTTQETINVIWVLLIVALVLLLMYRQWDKRQESRTTICNLAGKAKRRIFRLCVCCGCAPASVRNYLAAYREEYRRRVEEEEEQVKARVELSEITGPEVKVDDDEADDAAGAGSGGDEAVVGVSTTAGKQESALRPTNGSDSGESKRDHAAIDDSINPMISGRIKTLSAFAKSRSTRILRRLSEREGGAAEAAEAAAARRTIRAVDAMEAVVTVEMEEPEPWLGGSRGSEDVPAEGDERKGEVKVDESEVLSSPPSPGTARESRLGRLERLKRLSIEM
jgi:hypothetical protein